MYDLRFVQELTLDECRVTTVRSSGRNGRISTPRVAGHSSAAGRIAFGMSAD